MMKIIIAACAVLLLAQPASAVPCNTRAAAEVMVGIREFAQWRIEGDHLAVYWIYKIENRPMAERLKMVETYANMDACLSGEAREIHFYRKKKIMGIASPTSGIKLVN
jgi:hypothetical protein